MRGRGSSIVAIAIAIAAGPHEARGEAPSATAKPSVTASAKAPDESARGLFDRGVTAHDQGKLDVAKDAFGRAWRAQRSWDIAANLGIVERELGEHVGAAEHLAFALRALPPSESDDTRRELTRELGKVTPKVARVVVRSAVSGAEVRIAGEIKGTTPIDGPLFTEPGSVIVELRKDGYESASQRVDAKAGGESAVTFVMTPSPPARPIAWAGPAVAFGFGGAGLVTSAVAGTLAAVKLADLRKTCDHDLVCPAAARDAAEDGRAAANLATAGLVLAGAGLAVGVVLLVIPTKSGQGRVGVSVGPGVIGLKGAF